MYTLDDIKKEDQEIASAITDEFERQNSHIELIAVSYTHLDVYKRQILSSRSFRLEIMPLNMYIMISYKWGWIMELLR